MLRNFVFRNWCSFEQCFLSKMRHDQVNINSYYVKGPTKIAYKSRTGYCSSGQEGGDMRRGRFSGPERPRRRPRRTVPRPGLRRNLRRTDPLYCPKCASKPSRVLIFVSTITWRSYRLLWSPMPEISRSFDMHNRRKIRWIKNFQALYVSLRSVLYLTHHLQNIVLLLQKHVTRTNKGKTIL